MGKGLVRSSNALSVMNRFERKDAVLYVEGPTDRIFWKTIFDVFDIKNVSINIAGSCTIIDDYIKKIIDDDVKIFVARDKDYKFHLKKIPLHNRVLLTYGHSIENSLLCTQSLTDIFVINGGEYSFSSKLINEWCNNLIDIAKELVIREFANELSQSGVSVFGDHYEAICGKKLKECCLPKDKILDHINKIDKLLPQESILKAREIYEKIESQTYFYIKGHFLFSIAVKFIKTLFNQFNERDRDVNLSNDAVNMLLTQQFKFNVIDGKHPHKEHYKNEVLKIKGMLAA